MSLLVFYVVLALAVSFVCSVLEAVLLSVTPSYAAALSQKQSPAAGRLTTLKANVDRPLAAILSLNTIAHTVGAAGAGAQAQVVFGDAWLTAFSAVLTFLILILSEIIPKTLGATYWRRLAPTAARILHGLTLGLLPLVWMSEQITGLLSRGEHAGAHGGTTVRREEFAALAQIGHEQGQLDASESRILTNLFRFSELRAHDIMTPRTVVRTLDANHTLGEVVDAEPLPFSRIPVIEGNPDQVRGYVLRSDLLLHAARGALERKVGELTRPLMVVPAMVPVTKLFSKLLDGREQIALLVDEFGGTEGVATMEDIVETLMGIEIMDEADTVEDLRAAARDQWRHRATKLGIVEE